MRGTVGSSAPLRSWEDGKERDPKDHARAVLEAELNTIGRTITALQEDIEGYEGDLKLSRERLEAAVQARVSLENALDELS